VVNKGILYFVSALVLLLANSIWPVVPTWVALLPLLLPCTAVVLVFWFACLVGAVGAGVVVVVAAVILYSEYRSDLGVSEKQSQSGVA
jgi:hypothetical protein